MVFQKTLARKIGLSGIGVHSGKAVQLTLVPSDRGGIVFRRTDLAGAESPVGLERMESRNSTTLFAAGFKIQTVEHLMAALYAFGIDSLIVELDEDEVPILDGSALPIVQAIEQAGIRILESSCPRLLIRKSFALEDRGASIVVTPAAEDDLLTISYSIEYSHPGIGNQSLTWTLTPQAFSREIAPARTFGFLKDVDALRSKAWPWAHRSTTPSS
jgi:UDP-3-O-[3-hydroxymyristoyl] N-acetylglucosamine deacetylase